MIGSERKHSGICNFSAFLLLQLAQFTLLSQEAAVMDNHWLTAPGLQSGE